MRGRKISGGNIGSNIALCCGLRRNEIFELKWNKLREKLSFKVLSNGLILHFHDLLHCYAQTLRDAGVPKVDIQFLPGHCSIRVTEECYTMFVWRDDHNHVNRISSIIKLPKVI